MKRRDFLKGALATQILAGQMVLTTAVSALADERTGLPLSELKTRLGDDGSLLLFPSDAQFAAYQISFNKRTAKIPQARCLPKTREATAIAVKWAREYSIPFAVRGRGHSYEGYSQSDGLVIDLRLMCDVQYNPANQRASVGGGAQLIDVYEELAKHGMAIPAGSCPPVGVGGHTLGGGFGLLARKLGLACDSVLGMEMIDAEGNILTVTASENTELFWGLRGGGTGNFGIVTRFIFQAHPVGQVATYGITWDLPIEKAIAVTLAWQAWGPNAPDDITSIFRLMRRPGGLIRLHAAGVTVGSVADLKKELLKLTSLAKPISCDVTPMSFIQSVHHFGGTPGYESIYMKGKSDYVFKSKPLTSDALRALMKALIAAPSIVTAIFDSYGGKIGTMKNTDTAFVHREGALFCIQYYTQWAGAGDTQVHLDSSRQIYASMRPYVSGQSYVNYCDLDLGDEGPKAYWGANLTRLQQLKQAIDPTNFFRHAQSLLPVAASNGGRALDDQARS